MATQTISPSAAQLSAAFSRRMSEVRGAQMVGGRVALGIAGAMLTTEVKRLISHPYPPASQPSEPPHRRRGEDGGLLSTYDYEVSEGHAHSSNMWVLVGSGGADPLLLPVFLEFGTKNMEARPHLRPAAANLLQGGRGGVLREVFVREIETSIRRAVGR